MAYKPTFGIGDTVTNQDICDEYKVAFMGGMRKSNTYNCLVLISDHTKGLYEDKWFGNELHYTGMGQNGDQVLKGNQNGTLYYSDTNGIEVHLFEVLDVGQYTYRGVVKLADKPYQEVQEDVRGHSRKVWMFPLVPINDDAVVTEEEMQRQHEKRQRQAEAMSLKQLEAAAKARSTKTPTSRKTTTIQIGRDEFVSEYVKRLAAGKCELCRKPAPFKDKKGRPYLETHHVLWLSKGGSDSIDNAVALCPNCHRKMHIVNDPHDVSILKTVARNNAY